MKKIELLAPAGDKECFKAAVHSGADAIYIGGKAYSARKHASNFDNEDMKWAVEYAHVFGVKVYVTVNILYKDDEFTQVLSYIDFLYNIQIDALIIQDFGLFSLVHQIYPDFELHMSTQASIMNKQAAKFFEKKGAKRVVLARENTLNEIKEIIDNTQIEVEIFVHGALCVCYSGQCLMSSMIGKRSGNRGDCAQPCRLRYRLMQNDNLLEDKYPYLLSPRDLNTIDYVSQFIEVGVHSLKIEGRMKKPEYVASTVFSYRQAIDAYYNHQRVDLKKEKYYMLAMFNRNYTNGYLFNDKHIVDGDYSGNKGIIIGHVLSYNQKLKRVRIKLVDEVVQGDSIVFESIDKGRPINKMYKNGQLIHHAYNNDIIEIEFNDFVKDGNVRKTIDTQIKNHLQHFYSNPNYKQSVTMAFEAKIGLHAKLCIILDEVKVTSQSSSIVEKAKHVSTTKERIRVQLSKLGQTPFDLNEILIDMDDDISIPIKEINALRREACEKLESLLAHKKIHHLTKQNIIYPKQQLSNDHQLYVHVSNIEQLDIVRKYPNIKIIYPYSHDVIDAYQKYPNMILATPRILKSKEIEDLKNSKIYSLVDTLLIDNYGAYEAFNDKNYILGSSMNIYNSLSASMYSQMKILSVEMDLKNINELKTDLSTCMIQVFGKIENMVSEYCPISNYFFGYLKKNCQLCRNYQYSLIDRKGEKFDIICDDYCRIHLLNSHTLLLDKNVFSNVKNSYIHFTNEDSYEVEMIMDYFYYKDADLQHIKNTFSLTKGYYYE
ncbi:MAG: DUF3656 domain-containing protein [Erysipelotrichaceae bacterium]|nr:DUF3656 domain-containing protein [Erysipelotrichaceae bacterium]